MTQTLHQGDCLDIMPTLPSDSIDTIITDPPYGLSFMGRSWDYAVPGPEYWKAALRVAKPGAMLLAFGGTRTSHRLTCAIEDAGWEIRDCLMWLYGSGFPKSMDISKAIDKAAGAKREVVGVDQSRAARLVNQTGKYQTDAGWSAGSRSADITAPATDAAKEWNGWGTALKPAWEPIILAMKPFSGTFAANALEHGVAGLNIDGCRIGDEVISQHGRSDSQNNCMSGRNYAEEAGRSWTGRWPANLLLDEEAAAQLGDPSRYYYCAKASKREKGAFNTHPSVKPLGVMEWLCTLTATPTGGVVLDPFMGSGSTGKAAANVGRDFIGIELDPDYYSIATRRLEAA